MRFALVLALGTALSTAGLALPARAAPTKPAAAAPAADPTIRQPGWKTPRNAFGQPDLSGYWTNATLTPLTRNPRLTDKSTLSETEARGLEKAFADALAEAERPTDPNASTAESKANEQKLLSIRPDFAAAGGDVGGYNAFWLDPGAHLMRVNGEIRTSLLTTPNGQIRPRKGGGSDGGFGRYRDNYDSYEYRSLGERCIIGFGRNAGPPMLPNGFYNNDYYVLQTPDSVVIQVEMNHDARVIRLNGTHRQDGVRPYFGDSIGRFEGDTLVVETTNIPQSQNFYGSWKNLTVTEWFTRISPTRIHYRFQVDDPDTWAQPWGGEYDFAPMKGIIYEYACHEGNYALPAILAGARRAEQEGAAKTGAAAPAGTATKGRPGD